jgi:GDP-mannose 6-dehydrogenase
MRINIFGLGYVGCVSAACLARAGHDVTGVDIDPLKLDMIRDGKSPIVEPGLEDLIAEGRRSGRLSVSPTAAAADVSIVCVGTPSNDNGSLGLRYVERVSQQIGELLKSATDYHVVCVRSTVLPGTVEEFVLPILERVSGKCVGKDFGLCMNPEFMREGTSIRDYYNPPMTVIGEWDTASGERLASVYRELDAPLIRTSIKAAEMTKYVSNAFHALKVSFANEIGNLSKSLGVDSHEVMDIFCRDTKLNLSPYYLKPGFAFGGSCLPKDVRAILHEIKKRDLNSPVLEAILPSNENQIEVAFSRIKKLQKRKIGLVGLSFKPGSDDLRESPMVDLAERLIGKGYDVLIYDREVSLAKIFGSNKQFIETIIPHVSSLMRDSLEEVVSSSEIVIVAKKSEEVAAALARLNGSHVVLDLVRAVKGPTEVHTRYEGLCW